VFSFIHKPEIGILNTDTLNVSYYKIPLPFQDFFVDPEEGLCLWLIRETES